MLYFWGWLVGFCVQIFFIVLTLYCSCFEASWLDLLSRKMFCIVKVNYVCVFSCRRSFFCIGSVQTGFISNYLNDFYEILNISRIKLVSGREASRIFNFNQCLVFSDTEVNVSNWIFRFCQKANCYSLGVGWASLV